jgi:hypothetical protein
VHLRSWLGGLVRDDLGNLFYIYIYIKIKNIILNKKKSLALTRFSPVKGLWVNLDFESQFF